MSEYASPCTAADHPGLPPTLRSESGSSSAGARPWAGMSDGALAACRSAACRSPGRRGELPPCGCPGQGPGPSRSQARTCARWSGCADAREQWLRGRQQRERPTMRCLCYTACDARPCGTRCPTKRSKRCAVKAKTGWPPGDPATAPRLRAQPRSRLQELRGPLAPLPPASASTAS